MKTKVLRFGLFLLGALIVRKVVQLIHPQQVNTLVVTDWSYEVSPALRREIHIKYPRRVAHLRIMGLYALDIANQHYVAYLVAEQLCQMPNVSRVLFLHTQGTQCVPANELALALQTLTEAQLRRELTVKTIHTKEM